MKNKTKSKILSSKKKTEPVLSKKTKKQKLKVVYDVKIKKPKSVPKKKKTSVKPTDKPVVKPTETRMIIEVKRDADVDIIPKGDSTVDIDDDTVTLDDDQKKVRRRGRNKKEKIYFSKATEEAIIEYNEETDFDKRNTIYNERIRFSFEKLVENIYNTFKFTYFDNGPLEVQKETVAHLVANIHKFQAGKGKAFSYFSIVAKNYLIFHNNNNYKRFNQHVDISETPSEDTVCLQTEDAHHKDVQTQEMMRLLIDYWEKNITKIFNKSKDLNIAYAVIELFRNCDRIESFNKKTLYLYIREISNCKTQQITKVLNKMKSYQVAVMKNYMNRGTV
tara:strand:+ start:4673 stop:5671 length:999 start_codon:yes stop_codon:yes gene_type:complete